MDMVNSIHPIGGTSRTLMEGERMNTLIKIAIIVVALSACSAAQGKLTGNVDFDEKGRPSGSIGGEISINL